MREFPAEVEDLAPASQELLQALPKSQEKAAIELLRALEEAGAMTPTSLMLTDPEMPWERYEALCFFLGRINRSCSFWIGDLLVYGEETFGHYVYQAAEATGLAPQTLANRASVCRHIPPNRRRSSLPFGVHAEVAYLDPQERDRWLDRAELGDWTRAKLREEMRDVRGIEPGSMGDLAVTSKSEVMPREEHLLGVPAAKMDFLGELVSGPVQLQETATQITVALGWVPEEHRPIIVKHLRPEIRTRVQELLDEDFY